MLGLFVNELISHKYNFLILGKMKDNTLYKFISGHTHFIF